MTYDPQIHHRRSIRLRGYDYSQAGYYFLTICTYRHVCLFGHIQNGEMRLNDYGRLAHDEWLKTAEIRRNVSLGAFVVMPNHVHGILIIHDDSLPIPDDRGTRHRVPTNGGSAGRAPTFEQFGKPTSNSIPTIMRSYKAAVTGRIRQTSGSSGFSVWQRNYYEHVIRHEKAFLEISEYIKNNPLNWKDDTLYRG